MRLKVKGQCDSTMASAFNTYKFETFKRKEKKVKWAKLYVMN